MAEYIEREKVVSKFEAIKNRGVSLKDAIYLDGVMAVLDTIPAADVAEVVRCKDCKYRADRLYCRLRKTPYIVTNLDFCSYGEPLEG